MMANENDTTVEQADTEMIAPPPVPDETQVTAAEAPLLQPLLERLERLEQAITRLSQDIGQLNERTGLIPPQVRQVRERVDNITESITQPRIRDLLHSLLLLYDLVEPLAATTEPDSVHTWNYRVLRDQLLQLLRLNGISRIPETPRFDPYLHKALETVACTEPEEDGLIARCYRTGFRTEQAVLRYTDVAVKRYQAPVVGEEQP
ncbi:MAG: nucleotide exchange factor GrpE [Candidatus Competibacteraceae bacterium]